MQAVFGSGVELLKGRSIFHVNPEMKFMPACFFFNKNNIADQVEKALFYFIPFFKIGLFKMPGDFFLRAEFMPDLVLSGGTCFQETFFYIVRIFIAYQT